MATLTNISGTVAKISGVDMSVLSSTLMKSTEVSKVEMKQLLDTQKRDEYSSGVRKYVLTIANRFIDNKMASAWNTFSDVSI